MRLYVVDVKAHFFLSTKYSQYVATLSVVYVSVHSFEGLLISSIFFYDKVYKIRRNTASRLRSFLVLQIQLIIINFRCEVEYVV